MGHTKANSTAQCECNQTLKHEEVEKVLEVNIDKQLRPHSASLVSHGILHVSERKSSSVSDIVGEVSEKAREKEKERASQPLAITVIAFPHLFLGTYQVLSTL